MVWVPPPPTTGPQTGASLQTASCRSVKREAAQLPTIEYKAQIPGSTTRFVEEAAEDGKLSISPILPFI